jgi:iron only hydrogenase large subunit-like protein
MKSQAGEPLITTIQEKCRVCYTCVRECPAKAIRIARGRAEVIPDRCIGCGNCVRVCSQKAKVVLNQTGEVEELLAGGAPVAACLAPSFPAEFPETDYRKVVGMFKAAGFKYVNEVAFGADLVAAEYRKLLMQRDGRHYIATTCPALVAYVEKYAPELVGDLAPIVSPMVATARVLKALHGPEVKIIFVGPCIAKKGEVKGVHSAGEMDAALTFREIRQLFDDLGIKAEEVEPADFDPPRARTGALFSVSRGLLQAANINEDLLAGNVVAAEGRTSFVEAIKEFAEGYLDEALLEVLCCHGCISGAGMTVDSSLFSRRHTVRQFVKSRLENFPAAAWEGEMAKYRELDLSREYAGNDQRMAEPLGEELAVIMARMGKFGPEDELNCGACGYESCREHAAAIFKGLAESEMCLPYTIDQLRVAINDLNLSHEQLAKAQEALMQSEKMASMGQLAAGIAHEINNPLGVVLMYSHLLHDECADDEKMRDDLRLIVDQADRCKKIVSGLLHFARQNKVALQPTDLRELIDRTMKAIQIPDNIEVTVEHDPGDLMVELDGDQIVQVLANLVSNARDAMPEGGKLIIKTSGSEENVKIMVTDTGGGIPRENISKIFDPFFTTKQIGKGTGLGLAVTYGIIKMHRGDITVTSNTDSEQGATGTTFTVTLPRRERTN